MPRPNPVQEILQSHQFAPGHVVVEWVNVTHAQWFDASVVQTRWRTPPREPGNHLVAPGAQLLISMGHDSTELSFSRAVFIKHHHHWKFLVDTGPRAEGYLVGNGEVDLTTNTPRVDETVMRMLLAYTVKEAKEHGKPLRRRSREYGTAPIANPRKT